MTIIASILLGCAVLSAWLGCIGFLRFESALDRLHCVAFVSAGGGIAVTLAVIVQDGMSDRSWKALAVLIILLLGGAALMHAAGRAMAVRGEAG